MLDSKIALVPLTQADISTLQHWFEDRELHQRLSGMLPLPKYLAYVESEPNYFSWLAMEDTTPVGTAFVQISAADEEQSLAFLVNPALRSQGYGQQMLRALLTQPELDSIQCWQVGVEPDNIASQKCLLAVGFRQEGNLPDAEGFLSFVKNRNK